MIVFVLKIRIILNICSTYFYAGPNLNINLNTHPDSS